MTHFKNSKLSFFVAAGILMAAMILTGYGKNGFRLPGNCQKASSSFLQPGKIIGTTEFYYIPASEIRTWHIVNRYLDPERETGREYNVSEYIFTSDSVSVTNEFAGIPETKQWDLGLAGIQIYNNEY